MGLPKQPAGLSTIMRSLHTSNDGHAILTIATDQISSDVDLALARALCVEGMVETFSQVASKTTEVPWHQDTRTLQGGAR